MMAAPTFILHAEKLKSDNRVRVTAKHNLRELAAEFGADGHIDAERICLNRILRGPDTAQGVMDLMRKLLAEDRPVRLKKNGKPFKERDDGVRCIELLLTIPSSVVSDEDQFFHEAVIWIEQRWQVPILSFVVHRDEGAPHAHVLLLPLRDGCMVGGKLLGRYSDMLNAFHRDVAARHGLARGIALPPAVRRKAAANVMAILAQNPALLADPQVYTVLQAAIERNPGPLAELLGLPLPDVEPPREKAWVAVLTKPVPPESKPKRKASSIDFAEGELSTGQHGTDGSLCSVRLRSTLPSASSTDACTLASDKIVESCSSGPTIIKFDPEQPAIDDPPLERTIEREDAMPVEEWSHDLGKFIKPPQKRSAQAAARAAVQAALDA